MQSQGTSEYSRFQQEIVDSQIFDKLKMQLGMRNFNKLIKEKVRTVPLDLFREDLGLPEKRRAELTSRLNVVINCAASLDFEARIDVSVRVNVLGPLQLLKLAEEAPHMQCFLQVSTSFVNCDRTGFCEERMYDGPNNWPAELKQIMAMGQRELKASEKQILGNFPNAYCYSKRMCEHLLVANNHKKIPMVIARPSIFGTAANEPMPGWTDSIGLLEGVSLMTGMGILRDLPGNPTNIADIIPVDYCARQILVAIPYLLHANEPLLITACTSSSLNPTTWNAFFQAVTKYQNQAPYENRAGVASLTLHPTANRYQMSYKFKNKLPT